MLSLIYHQCLSLGTMYRLGRDGLSLVHNQILRTLVIALPTICLGFGIYKVSIGV